MDINEKLNEIIMEYNLDEVYPGYREYIYAQKLIDELIDSWKNIKILCICNCNDSKFYFENRICSDELSIDFLVMQHGTLDNSSTCDLNDVISAFDFKQYDDVYIISHNGAAVIGLYLRKYGVVYNCLYDYFEIHDLFLDGEWYDFLHDENSVVFYNAKTQLKTKRNSAVVEYYDLYSKIKMLCGVHKENIENLLYKKIIFVSLFIHDFVAAFHWLETYASFSNDNIYIKVKDELSNLLGEIKDALSNRTKRDILIHWVDKVPYKDIDNAEFLYNEIRPNSIFFTHMYTMSPFTVPSFVQMFAGKKPVDDGGWGEWFSGGKSVDQYKVIKDLESSGYKFLSFCRDFRNFPVAYIPSEPLDSYACASDILWNSLNYCLNSLEPLVILAHICLETHEPFWSTDMDDLSIGDNDLRYKLGIKAVDDQLRFYNDLYNENLVSIYLSDHGKEDFQSRFHCLFSIYAPNIYKPKEFDGLCCWLDFGSILHCIMNDKDVCYDELNRDYVQLQEFNWLDGKAQVNVFRKKGEISWLLRGFRGALTKKYIYLKFYNEIEWVIRNDETNFVFEPTWFQREDDLESINDDELEYLRECAGKNVCDNLELYYKYNKFSQKVFRLAYDHEIRKINDLNCLFDGFLDVPVYLRMGGKHTYELFSILTKANRAKICAIIDKNPKCYCASLGLDIIQSIPSNGIIVLSSYEHLDDLIEESKTYAGVKIVDIYSYLKNKGYTCRFPVYIFEPNIEEYDVGFPFEDFE